MGAQTPTIRYLVLIPSQTVRGETMQGAIATGLVIFSAALMIATGAVTFVACSRITAPYGRHVQKKGWGILVPARLSWFLMESPNLWIPYGMCRINFKNFSRPQSVLLGLFLMHYVQRSIIYPLFRLNGKYHQPLPISVPLLAFTYCSWNALTQVLSIQLPPFLP